MARRRRKGWFRRLLNRRRTPVVAVVRLEGAIGARLGRGGLTIDTVAPLLETAFSLPRLSAVALAVNSPGGSPVQSALIMRRVRALADEHKVPVFAYVEDVAASGGYWLALAGDEIVADRASIVGSIGVIAASFGFERAIERLGVSRRVRTAGDRKAGLDPFSPEDPRSVADLERILADLHATFRDTVEERRGSRLAATPAAPDRETLFSGAIWTGREAADLGLVDRLGDLHEDLRRRYGPDVRVVPVRARTSLLRRLTGGLGAEEALGALAERSFWSRFGL